MESLFTPKESAICLFLSCPIPFLVKSLLFLLPTNLTVLRETRWAASSLRNTQQMWRGVSGEADGCIIFTFCSLICLLSSSCFCFWISSFFFIASCKKNKTNDTKKVDKHFHPCGTYPWWWFIVFPSDLRIVTL